MVLRCFTCCTCLKTKGRHWSIKKWLWLSNGIIETRSASSCTILIYCIVIHQLKHFIKQDMHHNLCLCVVLWRQTQLQSGHCDQILYLSPIDFPLYLFTQVERERGKRKRPRQRHIQRHVMVHVWWCACTYTQTHTYTLGNMRHVTQLSECPAHNRLRFVQMRSVERMVVVCVPYRNQ